MTRLSHSSDFGGIAAVAGIESAAPVVVFSIASECWSRPPIRVNPPPTKTREPSVDTSIACTSSSASGSQGSSAPLVIVTAATRLRACLSTAPNDPPRYTVVPVIRSAATR